MIARRVHIASPNTVILKTGFFVKQDVHISKRTIRFPFQRTWVLDLTPKNYDFVLKAMSKEKMEFELPGVFTISPKNTTPCLRQYSERLSETSEENLLHLIKGVIEGETRILTASMTIEDIFSNKQNFKETIVQGVQRELEQFGLEINNANIREMQDPPESKYFIHLRQRVLEEALNKAKVDVAEARMRGEIGAKEREGETRRQVIDIEAITNTFENERKTQIVQSNSKLQVAEAENLQLVTIARTESEKRSLMRSETLQREVEQLRAGRELEKTRADQLSKAQVQAEVVVREMEGIAAARQKEAEADLFTEKRKAEGIAAIYSAEAAGIDSIRTALHADVKATMQYLMIKGGLYTELAKENAKALTGLNPKITVWNTGPGMDNSMKPVADLFKTLPPLISTIEEQTGVTMPSWMPSIHNKKEDPIGDVSTKS